jgi:hypothetical protein
MTTTEFLAKHDCSHMFAENTISEEALIHALHWGVLDNGEIRGVIILEKLKNAPAKYMVHIAFARVIRGKKAIRICRRWLETELKKYGKIVGFTPLKWRHACIFARMLKPARTFKTPNYLVTEFEK